MIAPGVYQAHYRHATLRELWRLLGPRPFCLGLLWKLFDQRGYYVWLPPSQNMAYCGPEALTEEARGYLTSVVAEMTGLGYRRGVFRRLVRNLNPLWKDAGAYLALHEDGVRTLSAIYTDVASTVASVPAARRVCHSGLIITEDQLGTAVVDHRFYLESGPQTRLIRFKPVGLRGIDERLQQEIQGARGPLRRFATVDELCSALDDRNDRWHEQLVQRGLYQRVSDEEERQVLARFGLADE
jgi:hypothetical protein